MTNGNSFGPKSLQQLKKWEEHQVQVPRNKWWDVDCRKAIEDKNKARQRLLQCRMRITREQYQDKRNEANRVCRNKKKKWLNDRILQIEENHRKNETRKFLIILDL
jgi:hypothetical protein